MRQPTSKEAMEICNAYDRLSLAFAVVDNPDFSGSLSSQASKYKRKAAF